MRTSGLAVLAALATLLSGCTSTADQPDAPTWRWHEIDASAVDLHATWVDVTDSTSTRGDVPVLHVGRVRAGNGPAVAAVWEGARVDVDSAAVVRDTAASSTLLDLTYVDDVPHALGRERVDGGWHHFVLARRGPGDWADVGVTELLDAHGIAATQLATLPDGGLVALGIDDDGATVSVALAHDRVAALPVPAGSTGPGDVVELVSTRAGVVAFLNAPAGEPGAWSSRSTDGTTWSEPLPVGPAGKRGQGKPGEGAHVEGARVEGAHVEGALVEGAQSPDGRTLVVTADVTTARRPGDAVFTSRDHGLTWTEEVFVPERKNQPSVLSRPAVTPDGDVLVARTGLTQGHSETWRRSRDGTWRPGDLVPGWWYYGTVPLLSADRGDTVIAYRQVGGTSQVRRGAKTVVSTGLDDVWATEGRIARWAGVTRVVARDQIGLSLGARLRGRVLDVIPGGLAAGEWNRADFERTPPHVVASSRDLADPADPAGTAVALSNEISGDGWESLVRASTPDGRQWRVVPVDGNSRMLLLHDVAHHADSDTWWLTGTDLEGRPRLWRAGTDLTRFEAVTLPSPARGRRGTLSATCSTAAGEWIVVTPDAAGTSAVLLRRATSWRDVAALPVGTTVDACAGVEDQVVVLGSTDSGDGPTLLSSADGARWEPATLPDDVHTVHAVSGGDTVAVAHGTAGRGSRTHPVVLTSNDGRTWREATLPTRAVEEIEDVTVIDGDVHVLAPHRRRTPALGARTRPGPGAAGVTHRCGVAQETTTRSNVVAVYRTRTSTSSPTAGTREPAGRNSIEACMCGGSAKRRCFPSIANGDRTKPTASMPPRAIVAARDFSDRSPLGASRPIPCAVPPETTSTCPFFGAVRPRYPNRSPRSTGCTSST